MFTVNRKYQEGYTIWLYNYENHILRTVRRYFKITKEGWVEGYFYNEAVPVPDPSLDDTEAVVQAVVVEQPSTTGVLREVIEAFCAAGPEVDDENEVVEENVPDMADNATDIDWIFGYWDFKERATESCGKYNE